MTSVWVSERNQLEADFYLCKVEEARQWISGVLKEEMPSVGPFELQLSNGVILARLISALWNTNGNPPQVFDREMEIYHHSGLQEKHTENILFWLDGLEKVELEKKFFHTVKDLYERQGMPRVIYSLHALILHMNKTHGGPLYGKLPPGICFDEETLAHARDAILHDCGLNTGSFKSLFKVYKEQKYENDEAASNTVEKVNNWISTQNEFMLLKELQNGIFENVNMENVDSCTLLLREQLKRKGGILKLNDIQDAIDYSNVERGVAAINASLSDSNVEEMLWCLQNQEAGIRFVKKQLKDQYLLTMQGLKRSTEAQALTLGEIQMSVFRVNTEYNKTRMHAKGGLNSHSDAKETDEAALRIQSTRRKSAIEKEKQVREELLEGKNIQSEVATGPQSKGINEYIGSPFLNRKEDKGPQSNQDDSQLGKSNGDVFALRKVQEEAGNLHRQAVQNRGFVDWHLVIAVFCALYPVRMYTFK
eukprot:Nk52_evm7s2578 gene=Nk52_evmTU7s2578